MSRSWTVFEHRYQHLFVNCNVLVISCRSAQALWSCWSIFVVTLRLWRTVEWSRPPKVRPISWLLRPVNSRTQYIARPLGRTWHRRWDPFLISSGSKSKCLATVRIILFIASVVLQSIFWRIFWRDTCNFGVRDAFEVELFECVSWAYGVLVGTGSKKPAHKRDARVGCRLSVAGWLCRVTTRREKFSRRKSIHWLARNWSDSFFEIRSKCVMTTSLEQSFTLCVDWGPAVNNFWTGRSEPMERHFRMIFDREDPSIRV